MDDELMRVAMGLHLGVSLCHLCGAGVDDQGTLGLHCQRRLGRHPRNMAISDLIKRSLATAKIVVHLEPVGNLSGKQEKPGWGNSDAVEK